MGGQGRAGEGRGGQGEGRGRAGREGKGGQGMEGNFKGGILRRELASNIHKPSHNAALALETLVRLVGGDDLFGSALDCLNCVALLVRQCCRPDLARVLSC